MTVLGLPLVLANLNRIAGQIVLAEHVGLANGAERIRAAWVDNIESAGLVDTGAYRDSIRVVAEGDEVGVVTAVEYARFHEFGTSDIEAHPVAERAAEEQGERAIDDVADAVRRVVR